MTGLSESEIDVLDGGIRQWEDFGGRVLAAITPAVEQIVTARVAAALTEAADAITAKCVGDPFAKPCKSCRDAAEIVRAAIPTDPAHPRRC